MANPETLKVISIENTYSHSGSRKVRTALLSKPDNNIPVAQLPINKDIDLQPDMIVEVTPRTTEPNENGGTYTTYEINPQR